MSTIPSTTPTLGWMAKLKLSNIPRSTADLILWISFVRSARSEPKNRCGSGSQANIANGISSADSLFTTL